MRTTAALTLAAGLTLSLAACGGLGEDEGSATMRPGENCLGCHSFTAAGTVFASPSSSTGVAGATVTLGSVVLTTNSAGNFFTSAALGFPLTATIATTGSTQSHAHSAGQTGACNTCHGTGNRLTP